MIGGGEPGFQLPHDVFCGPESGAARRRFKAVVRPHNLCIRDGSVRVRLAVTPAEALRQMAGFGEVLSLTRNRACSLGAFGILPAGTDCRCCAQVGNAAGSLAFRANPAIAVDAVLATVQGVGTLGLEFIAASGRCAHRMCLTRESDWEAFLRLVEIGQPRFRRGDDAGTRHHLERHGAAPAWIERHRKRKRRFGRSGSQPARSVSIDLLRERLGQCLRSEQTVNVTVFDADAVQSQVFRPTWHEFRFGWHHITDGRTTWQFCPSRIAEVWLVRWPADPKPLWAVEAYDTEDRILFAAF